MKNLALEAKEGGIAHRLVLLTGQDSPRLCFGACELDVTAHVLLFRGQERHLEPRAFDLLLYLVSNRGRVISKQELLESLWPTRHVTENVVARCIMKVRQSLEDTTQHGGLIRTLHRVGYRFDAEVSESSGPAASLAARGARHKGSSEAPVYALPAARGRL